MERHQTSLCAPSKDIHSITLKSGSRDTTPDTTLRIHSIYSHHMQEDFKKEKGLMNHFIHHAKNQYER